MTTATDVEPTQGFWDVPSLADYHVDRLCESHSTLEALRDSSSAYHQVYVLGTLPRREPSDSMILGTALHAYVLEPDRWGELVAVEPAEIEGRTKAIQAKAEEWRLANAGKLIINQKQFDLVQVMANSLKESPTAGPLLFDSPGRNERAIRWQDSETGIWLKASFDRLLNCGIDLNLKTTRNPNPKSWAKDAANFGYHRQTSLYQSGKSLAADSAGESLHVVVGTEPPHLVAVFELGPSELDLGRRENRETLERLAYCRDTGDWQDAWESSITPISFPRWAFQERQ